MDCRRVGDLLPAYLDDALSGWRSRAVTRHLAACEPCRRDRAALEAALHALDRVSRRTPSIDLWASFAKRLAAERALARSRRLRPAAWVLRTAGGLAAAAVATGACVLSLATAGSPPLTAVRSAGPAALAADRPTTGEATADAPRAEREPVTVAIRSPEPIEAFPGDGTPRPLALPAQTARKSAAAREAPRPAISKPGPERGSLVAAKPAAELKSVAEALMEAPQDAAREEVARAVFTLAEGIVRAGDAPNLSSEDPL